MPSNLQNESNCARSGVFERQSIKQTNFKPIKVSRSFHSRRNNRMSKRFKRNLKLGKSSIHDLGLFAQESIPANEFVIEYVGEKIRPIVADMRQCKSEAKGIRSSYLFKINAETIVDAFKCGNMARYINHCCDPNCIARIINKKVYFYSKRAIPANEEISIDYKFAAEDVKIQCSCGAEKCRRTLN